MKTTLLTAIAVALLFAGCIKDPQPPIPEPPKNPGWLIVKWTHLDIYEQFFPDPDGPPNTIVKRESVMKYNEHYKPEVQQMYQSGVNDTANLQLVQIDSFFYDGQHRMTGVKTYRGAGLPLRAVRNLGYNGSDTMPGSINLLNLSSGSEWSVRCIYLPEDVLTISVDEKTGMEDTTRYVYENGNYVGYVRSGVEYEVFLNYTSGPNPRRSFNIPHGAGAIGMPPLYEDGIRLSRNHHGNKMWFDEIVSEPLLNAQGLVSQVRYTNPYTIGNKYHIITYEYSDDVLK